MELTKEQRKENRRKWVEALRSGKYEQGKGYLCRDGKYCCLGVLCEVMGLEKKMDSTDEGLVVFGHHLTAALDPHARATVGLVSALGTHKSDSLSELNDSGLTFAQIADIIESEPEGLFID